MEFWSNDSPLFREESRYWNPLEREEHVFVFTRLNYFAQAKKLFPDGIDIPADDLEKYCALDTEGMIWIVDKLKELA